MALCKIAALQLFSHHINSNRLRTWIKHCYTWWWWQDTLSECCYWSESEVRSVDLVPVSGGVSSPLQCLSDHSIVELVRRSPGWGWSSRPRLSRSWRRRGPTSRPPGSRAPPTCCSCCPRKIRDWCRRSPQIRPRSGRRRRTPSEVRGVGQGQPLHD